MESVTTASDPRPAGAVFISHASADDAFVRELRETLEAGGISVWVDSRVLRGGSKLAPEIERAIDEARQVVVVLSPATVNSPWVRREVGRALQVEARRGADGYRVVPLLLPGITPGALGTWFDEEPVAVPVEVGPTGLDAALPAILAALGERLPTDATPYERPEAQPVAELVLTLEDPRVETHDGRRRATATATVTYEPAEVTVPAVTSRRFTFTAPLGVIETDDLRWYLERYYLWPTGVFRARAEAIEARLPQWGEALFAAALGAESARAPLDAWRGAPGATARRFSVQVDADLPEGTPAEAQGAANAAASELLALPWELLRDGGGWLFQGRQPSRVRRRLPNRTPQPSSATGLPIRILLVSPRPERDRQGNPVGYFDHRASARPLVEAVESLGDALMRLTVLAPPTYAALEEALVDAAARGTPFDVVHFDGHGVYSREHGLGALLFEDPADGERPEGRRMELVQADRVAALFRAHRVPLVFLEACQSAAAEGDPTASVAARLLQRGVTSVVAMTHSVLVETARRFVGAFYGELAEGARVGNAMIAGQRALHADPRRGTVMGAGELRLQDWFVPVLYQEEQDPQLVTRVPPEQLRRLQQVRRTRDFGALPAPPPHRFHGRSQDLLALERLLARDPYAVVRGIGGMGKTTLAAELARWLVRSERFERAAFVSLEHHRDATAVLDALGRQLLPDGEKYSVALFPSVEAAWQPVARALEDRATIVVVDNCESVLPLPAERDAEPAGAEERGATALAQILALCERMLAASAGTRLLFTSRESLPAPFDDRGRERELGALGRQDAVELVGQVLAQEGLVPNAGDAGQTPREVEELVEAVNRHPRALVLLAREVARRGVRGTTAELRTLMAELERRHPGERENSLYASVALSLARLAPASRERVTALAPCQGGVHLAVLAVLTGLDVEGARQLGSELLGVALAEDLGGAYLQLDPGLAPFLLGGLSETEAEQLVARWAAATEEFMETLMNARFGNTRLAAHLIVLELPNLLALLRWGEDRYPPDRFVHIASAIEEIVAPLGRPRALAAARDARERAAKRLGGWSHAHYLAETARIERLREAGDVVATLEAARQLLARCLEAGEAAYPGASYDCAMAYFHVGRALKTVGSMEAALERYDEARRRFEALAQNDRADATRMAAVVLSEMGDCLDALGRLTEAAAAYEETVRRAEERGDTRSVAVNKGNLADVRLKQRKIDEALAVYHEVRRTFELLGEPRSILVIWNKLASAYREAGRLADAEDACLHALAIAVREGDLSHQASTLGRLGNLYMEMERVEESVPLHRQAAEIHVRLNAPAGEGNARHNLAFALSTLGRHDEARREAERALVCKKPLGHGSSPWLTWQLLEMIERGAGRPEAAREARRSAVVSYVAYRRDGGVSASPVASLYDRVARAAAGNDPGETEALLARLAADPAVPGYLAVALPALRAILAGARDPGLADDPALDYDDAAELRLILERLAPPPA